MTLFEKIYLTWLVVGIILLFIACFASEGDELLEIALFTPIELWGVFTIGYLIVKLILWIWGIDISLFPNFSLMKG